MESGAKELSQAAGPRESTHFRQPPALTLNASGGGAVSARRQAWTLSWPKRRAPTTQRDRWRFSFSRTPSRRGVAQLAPRESCARERRRFPAVEWALRIGVRWSGPDEASGGIVSFRFPSLQSAYHRGGLGKVRMHIV
ncbi:hypothetical protein MTO96_015840 [Rhipicephalus appendiculatus]